VFTDLLTGVALGMFISIFAILRGNMKRAYYFRKEEYEKGDIIHIHLAQEVSFLNKAAILFTLNKIPDNSKVIINASDTVYIAHDILDSIKEFRDIRAPLKNIDVTLIGFKNEYDLSNTETDIRNVSVEHNLLMKHRERHKTSSEEITEIKYEEINGKNKKKKKNKLKHKTMSDFYKQIIETNKKWVESKLALDQDYFKKLKDTQTPPLLWIGCSDSRVPASQIIGAQPGE